MDTDLIFTSAGFCTIEAEGGGNPSKASHQRPPCFAAQRVTPWQTADTRQIGQSGVTVWPFGKLVMCMKRTGTLFQKHSWEKDFCTVECFQHISLKGEINLGKLPNLKILWFN